MPGSSLLGLVLGSLAAAAALPTSAAAAPPAAAMDVPGASSSGLPGALARGTGCLPSGKGYLRVRIRGAVDLNIDWTNAQLQCDGEARPSGHGIRVSFAGPPRPRGRVRMIFGIAMIGEGQAGRALPANVTVIFDGEQRLFATRGQDKCTIDSLRQERLGAPSSHAYRVVARGFCFEPVSGLIRNERIVISRFDFAGRIEFPQESPE